ncbi:MAG: hypothetical protein F6K19_01505 [Cyanothece sp. SIO1E1]|nr:hypothetical protein [Cyanothece sp. SIO1E1]
MQPNYGDAVEKTVEFWIEKSFRTRLNQNNGDDSSIGGFAFLLMNQLSMKSQDDITEEQIEKFREKLTELLLNDDSRRVMLDVDYHPCDKLTTAAIHAGIDTTCFPCKTYTAINREDNTVDAKFTYNGRLEKL